MAGWPSTWTRLATHDWGVLLLAPDDGRDPFDRRRAVPDERKLVPQIGAGVTCAVTSKRGKRSTRHCVVVARDERGLWAVAAPVDRHDAASIARLVRAHASYRSPAEWHADQRRAFALARRPLIDGADDPWRSRRDLN